MNNTPIQSNTIYMQACIKRMFAAIALIVALMCPHAHALDTSPHWEEIAGVNRYGYWQEGSTAGYWDETAGYWDYSAGNGHFETIYSNPVYDEEGNFISEDSSLVWVLDPEWVSDPEWVPPVMTWVDVIENNVPFQIHSASLDISIHEPQKMPGQKAWAYLEWEVDEAGVVTEKKRESGVGSTPLFPGWIEIPGGGFSQIEGNPGSESAQITFHGKAWSWLNLPGFFSSDASIDWNLSISMNYGGGGSSSGQIFGTHDHYPSYLVEVDDILAYQHAQEPYGILDADGINTNEFGSVPVNQGF
jgi:hypothetical protein